MVDIPGAPLTDAAEEDRFHTIRIDALAAHHDVLLSALQEVADGKLKRLMVFMPPGSAKSTYCSVVFPAWLMGIRPKTQIILACYGSDLARKQGRRARQLVKSKGYQSLFGVGVSAQSAAADEWAMDNESEFMGGGILAGMTGNRADGIICDDPVKGREEAESETIRRKVADAYQDDLCTRLKPHGWQIIVQTRWHQSDLSGSKLPEGWDGESGDILCRDGQVWRVICIPAQADRVDDPLGRRIGDYLWPEWFPESHWTPFRANARTWSSLFQGKPSPEEGTYFRREWFARHEPVKPADVRQGGMRVYVTSDFAVTEGKGDFTELAVWGYGADQVLRQLDWWHGQTTSDVWIERAIDLIAKWRPQCFFGEAGVIQKAIAPALLRRMRERKVLCRMEWVPSVNDKPSRARAFQARASMGLVSLLAGEVGERVLSQMLQFPAGRNDDAVDCCSMMGLVIDEAHPGVVASPSVERSRPRDGYAPPARTGDEWQVL